MKSLIRTTAVVVGSSGALLVGGIAHADPGQPVGPGAQAPNVVDQLVNTVANAPQMLQNLQSALGATPAAPAAQPPLASAALQMPPTMPGTAATAPTAGIPGLAPATAPGATGLPGMTATAPGATGLPGMTATAPGATGLPGMTSAIPGTSATAPAAAPGSLAPTAKLDLPEVPFLPIPLPQQVSLPGDLTSLATGGVSAPHPATTVTSGVPGGALLPPVSALP